jgi:hypothetical protein
VRSINRAAVDEHVNAHGQSGVPRNFFQGVGGSKNSVGDRVQREWGSGGGSPLGRGPLNL